MTQTDLSKALKLRVENGLSYRAIGKILGKSRQSIHSKIKKLLPDDSVTIYKELCEDIIANKEMNALAAMTDAKLKKASARDLVIVYGTLHDKRHGKSNGVNVNVSVHSMLVEASMGCQEDPAEQPVIECKAVDSSGYQPKVVNTSGEGKK